MKTFVLTALVLLSVSANASQPCATRASGTLHSEKSYDSVLPGQTAAAKVAPAKSTSTVKGSR